MLKLNAIKTPNYTYISINEKYGYGGLGSYVINGQNPNSTFHDRWFSVKGEIETIQRKAPNTYVNPRYELIDKSLESDKIKPLVSIEDATDGKDEDGHGILKESFRSIAALYELKRDIQDNGFIDVDFSLNVTLNLDHDIGTPQFSYGVYGEWDHHGKTQITWRDISENNIIPLISLPELVHHEVPVKLTSKQFYNIVRAHVKDNIDPKYAKITSDYEFCFAVDKNITLNNPYEETFYKLFGKKNQKPVKKWVSNRAVKIFEMTHSEENYKGYTPIKGIEASNIKELKLKVDAYLEDLMSKINRPLKECSHCSGYGVTGVVHE